MPEPERPSHFEHGIGRPKASDASRIFLRNVGFDAVNTFHEREKGEPPKIVFERNRFRALLRSAVHIIPVTAVSILLGYNLDPRHRYRGPTISDRFDDDVSLAVLQVVAKLLVNNMDTSVKYYRNGF